MEKGVKFRDLSKDQNKEFNVDFLKIKNILIDIIEFIYIQEEICGVIYHGNGIFKGYRPEVLPERTLFASMPVYVYKEYDCENLNILFNEKRLNLLELKNKLDNLLGKYYPLCPKRFIRKQEYKFVKKLIHEITDHFDERGNKKGVTHISRYNLGLMMEFTGSNPRMSIACIHVKDTINLECDCTRNGNRFILSEENKELLLDGMLLMDKLMLHKKEIIRLLNCNFKIRMNW